ncbi:hypothetical protein KI387_042522, partial [Taxus chinensis]
NRGHQFNSAFISLGVSNHMLNRICIQIRRRLQGVSMSFFVSENWNIPNFLRIGIFNRL